MESGQIKKIGLGDYQLGETLGTGYLAFNNKVLSVESESRKIKYLQNSSQ